VKKDYGDAYDPNYRKNKWRKGGVPENKNMAPAVPRQKNERGDYVVTSFVIPDRKEAANTGEKVSLRSIANEPNYSRLFASADASLKIPRFNFCYRKKKRAQPKRDVVSEHFKSMTLILKRRSRKKRRPRKFQLRKKRRKRKRSQLWLRSRRLSLSSLSQRRNRRRRNWRSLRHSLAHRLLRHKPLQRARARKRKRRRMLKLSQWRPSPLRKLRLRSRPPL
jgi:hypothetical protein